MQYTVYSTNPAPQQTTPPSPEFMAEMGQFIGEAMQAGIVVATGGLAPKGTRLTLSLFLPDEPLAPLKLESEVLGAYDNNGGMRLRFRNPSVDAVKRNHRYLSCIQD